jgi:hypothetical protein
VAGLEQIGRVREEFGKEDCRGQEGGKGLSEERPNGLVPPGSIRGPSYL